VSAIQEMLRVLKVGGKGLVTVWAKEQKLNNQESVYIQKNKSKKQVDEPSEDKDEAPKEKGKETENEDSIGFIKKPQVHEFGKTFEKQDLFVTWHYKKMNEKKKEQKKDKSENDGDQVYLRYYHVFQSKELESLFEEIQNAHVVHSYYEQGNWCAVFEKLF
jgi:alkylated DNA repair protein alkB family protein 8